MSYRSTYDKGNWLAVCDECGRKVKASSLRLRWDNLMVCPRDWEPRQPQDFVRAKVDIQAVPWSRPEASDTFIVIGGMLQENGSYILLEQGGHLLIDDLPLSDPIFGYDYGTAIAGIAIAGVAISGIGSSLSPGS